MDWGMRLRSITVAETVILFFVAVFFSPMVQAAGCPPGSVKVGEREEETADSIIVHPICQKIGQKNEETENVTAASLSPCNSSGSQEQRPGTVSPGMLVTKEECESAFRELDRLNTLRDKLTKKIAEVQGWGNGLNGYEKEFEAMRIEAQEYLAWEFIDHLPVSEGLDALKESGFLKNINIKKIKLAYGLSKGLLETGRGISEKKDPEKAQIIIDGNRELRNALIEAAGANEGSKRLLDSVAKILTAGAKTATISGFWDKMSDRDKLKFSLSIVEISAPLVVGPLTLAENLSERYVQNHEAQVALASLHEAQSSNWNAHRYLTDKLNRVNEVAKEEQFIIDKYKMAPSIINH
jgi:hypothetical protein